MTRRPVFVSKTLVPQRPHGAIRRDQLLVRFLADESPVTTVIAPAGYGKTTLLIDAANEWPGDVAWVSLDEWDRDPVRFLLYLTSALSDESAGRDLRGAEPSPETLHDRLGEIVERVSRGGTPTLLILDDFHLVEDSVMVVDLGNYLIRRLPPEMRAVIASRHEVPMEALPKLQLGGRVSEYTVADLSFGRDEVQRYYRNRGDDLSDSSLDRILEVTGGWPAGVALMGDPSTAQDPRRDAGVVANYVAAEVLRYLPDSMRDFLSRTSVLQMLDPDSCDWLLDTNGSRETLTQMAQSSIPLTNFGGSGVELRIHPLVRDLLRSRLRDEDPSLYRSLNLRAAERAEGLGQQSEAVGLYIEADEWAKAAHVIGEQAPRFYRMGRWHTVAAWIRQFPTRRLKDYPILRWWEARILARLGEIDGALRTIAEAVHDAGSEVELAMFGTLRASALRAKGDVSGALVEARQAVDLSMGHNAPIDVVAEARKELGLALMAGGSVVEAIDEFRAVLALQERSGNTEEAAFVNGCLGSALGANGQLAESTEYLERARQQWQLAGNTKELCWVLNNLGITYQRIGQGELAADVLGQCIAKSRQSSNRRAEAYALISMADMEIHAGDVATTLSRYEDAYGIAAELNDHTALTHARSGIALCHGKLGELERGITIARQAIASAMDRRSAFEEGIALSCLGRLLRQRGDVNDAVTRLSEAVNAFDRTSSRVELAQTILYLTDAALSLRSSRTLARVSLERFAKLAVNLGDAVYWLLPANEVPKALEYGASRRIGGSLFREMVRRGTGGGASPTEPDVPRSGSRLPEVRLKALGSFEVEIGGRSVLGFEWESEKAREMFLLIATSGGKLTRDEIIAALWPDAGGRRASSLFHSTLHRVRQATYTEAILESGGSYFLNGNVPITSDVDAFRAGISEFPDRLSDPDRAPALRGALALYRGTFAPGVEAEWADSLRRSLEESFLRASIQLTTVLMECGDYGGAVGTAQRVLEVDPFSETACLLLMRAQSAAGDVESALRTFRRFSETLDLELGELPAESLTRLQSELRDLVGQS